MSSIQRAMERKRRAAKGAPTATPDPAAETAPETAATPDPAAETAPEAAAKPAEADAAAPAVARRHPVASRREVYDIRLDLERLRGEGLLTPDADHRHLQEQYRLVKRYVINQAFPAEPSGPNAGNLVQVTSSVQREGKTFTAFNLGMSIAMEVDFTVLLIDADLTSRSLTRLVGLEGEKGITDVLTGSVADVGDVVFRTDIPQLAVIPAGHQHPRATELVASVAMRRLTQELASRYPDRLVIFDSTPLLLDSQASTLARHMGQVLVVVEAGRTQDQAVREAVSLLDTGSSWVGTLLNKSSSGRGYGYYGGY